MAGPSHRGLGRRGAVLLVLLLAALGSWVVLARRQAEPPPKGAAGLLEHIPANAFLVAVVDVDRLRATELGRRLLGDGRRVSGLGEIQQLCGSDPMDRVMRLAVAVPEGDDLGFGLFATGDIRALDLVGCAERIVTERGGRPVRRTSGRFTLLKDASASLSSAQLAAADGGPLILGEAPYVAESLRLADGEGESLASARSHLAIREELTGDVVQATVVLSADQRVTLAKELALQGMADSPFASVVAAGLGVSLGQEMALHGVLVCEVAGDCAGVAEALDEARRGEARTTTAMVSGLDAVLERLTVRAERRLVHLRLSLPTDEALALVQRLLALRRLAQGAAAASSARPRPPVEPGTVPSAGPAPSPSVERLLPAPPGSAPEPSSDEGR